MNWITHFVMWMQWHFWLKFVLPHYPSLHCAVPRLVLIYVTKKKDSKSDHTHAHVFMGFVVLVRDDFSSEHDKYAFAWLGQKLSSKRHVFERFVLAPATQHVRHRRIRANEQGRPVFVGHDLFEGGRVLQSVWVSVEYDKNERAGKETRQSIREHQKLAALEAGQFGHMLRWGRIAELDDSFLHEAPQKEGEL